MNSPTESCCNFLKKHERAPTMHACPNSPDTFDRLRRQAEERIRKSQQQNIPPPDDTLELIHELHIHQAELEIQNEELKRAQQELSDLYQQYERLYEFAPCGYVTLDPRGIITRVNLTAFNLLGTPKRHLMRSDFRKYLTRAWQDTFMEACSNAGRTGEKQRIEIQLKRKNGPPLWVRSDIAADRDENEAVVQWQVMLCDIVREKEAETLLCGLNQTLEQRVADRTAVLEQRTGELQQLALDLTQTEDRERRYLAAILHDDFQQQAAFVKMELDRLARLTDTDLQQPIMRLADFTGDFIDKMRHLAYSLNPPSLHRSGLLTALDALAKDMQVHHGLAVTLRVQPIAKPISPPLASILFRSVRELLINVVKHARVGEALVEVCSQDKRIQVAVTDKGIGFEYPAVKNGECANRGFGLYNIEDRLKFIGGRMKIDTRSGKGSRIALTVPYDISFKAKYKDPSRTVIGTQATTSVPAGTAATSDDRKQIRILLVEDHKLIRKGLSELLQSHADLTVVGECVDGAMAIKLAARLKPDVILMDVTMPNMDGIEATACISRQHPDIRIIGLSMHNDDNTRQKMIDAGAVAFLAKTDSPEKLLKTIFRVYRDANRTKRKTKMNPI